MNFLLLLITLLLSFTVSSSDLFDRQEFQCHDDVNQSTTKKISHEKISLTRQENHEDFIHDPERILSDEDKQAISQQIRSFHHIRTKIIITSTKIDILSPKFTFSNERNEPMEEYMLGDSIVIAVATKEGSLAVYFKNNGILSQFFTQSTKNAIVQAMMPYFQQYQYGKAFTQGIVSIQTLFQKEMSSHSIPSSSSSSLSLFRFTCFDCTSNCLTFETVK